MNDSRTIIGLMGIAIVISLGLGLNNIASSNREVAKELHEINAYLFKNAKINENIKEQPSKE